jgi:hypothetical protein
MDTDRIADGNYLPVYTNRSRDEIISVSNFFRQKKSVGNSIGFRRFPGSVYDSLHYIPLQISKS